MIVKITTGLTGVWRSAGETSKVMASSGIEIASLSLKSGSGAATCVLYDASSVQDATPSNVIWVLDSSQAGNDNQNFTHPIQTKNGLVAILEQGADTNAILCVEKVGGTPRN